MAEDATQVTIQSLLIDGEGMRSDLANSITSASLNRTFDGAPTLTIEIRDAKRSLLRSGIFSKRITCQYDDVAFELIQVRKNSESIGLVFEHLVVAELRRHDSPRKAEPGTVTRIEFARLLLSETPWIPLIVNPIAKASKAKVELARGRVATADQVEEKEDTWTALKRIFAEIGWRCYVDAGGVNVGPDYAYIDKGTVVTMREFQDGVDYIDFDFDSGKPMATFTANVRAKRWQLPPGTPITIEGQGPADGVWIISSVERSLFTTAASVTGKRPEPELPEPEPPPEPDDAGTHSEDSSGASGGIVGGAVSSQGFIWPVKGQVSSEYGARNGRQHAGIDIAAPRGTTIGAAKDGTVTSTGNQGGYGNVVHVTHGSGLTTKYAHMSRITSRRGQIVKQGDKLGEVGSTGNSTGNHVHFEVRINGKATNPRKYL